MVARIFSHVVHPIQKRPIPVPKQSTGAIKLFYYLLTDRRDCPIMNDITKEDSMKTAVAYYRTSSATGVGNDKGSEDRQRDAVMSYARENGIEVVREYYDAAVKGTDSVSGRPQFAKMLEYMLGNGARIILVETVNRFARDLIVQLTGHQMLKKHGIALIPVDMPDHFADETETSVLVRQILGAVAEFEKTALVNRMRKGIERKRALYGRCEGRKPAVPGAVEMARRLRDERMSYRDIGLRLAEAGYFVMSKDGVTDRVYKAQSVKHMLGGSNV